MTIIEQKLYEIIEKLYNENKELQKRIVELEQEQAELDTISVLKNSFILQQHVEKLDEIFGEERKDLWFDWLKGEENGRKN